MIKKSEKQIKAKVSFLLGRLVVFAVAMLVFAAESFAQYDYEMSLYPRRLGNQLGVEIWVKTINPSASPLGEMNIGVSYNGNRLVAENITAPNQPSSKTDAVKFDVDVSPEPLPYYIIESDFHNKPSYGFANLSATPVTSSIMVLNVSMNNATIKGPGFVPSSQDRGSFVGLLRFNIKNADLLTDTVLSGFEFNTDPVNKTTLMSGDGLTELTSLVNFKPCEDFTIRGITILNPGEGNQSEGKQTVNRYPMTPYLSMRDNHGYPIYFERSGLATPSQATGVYGTPKYAYKLEYSLNNGLSYIEFGRIAESRLRASQMTTEAMVAANAEGMVDFLDATVDYYMTTGTIKALPEDVPTLLDLKDEPDGPGLDNAGYGGMLRIIWKGDENFPFRSENAKLRITQIETIDSDSLISLNEINRPAYEDSTRMGTSNVAFVLGRLFFAQLNAVSGGACQYLKTAERFSTPSAFTVEAWVNLNGDKGDGSEPAIVATSSGSASPEEGGWMLYLKDGKYPAFRVRVANGGPTDYVGVVQSSNPLPIYTTAGTDTVVLNQDHSSNWTHVAAVVNANTVMLYVNGEQVDKVTNNTSMLVRPMPTEMPIWIGVNPNKGFEPEDFFCGGVKEVKIWRTPLSQQELRQYISGVPNPTKDLNTVENDPRTALEMYYTFQGMKTDAASDIKNQWNANPLHYYIYCDQNASAYDEELFYRPDGSHIKLTSPACGEGVSNLKGNTYEVRWVAFGVGNPLPSQTGEAGDIMIQLSRDGGNNWFDAIGVYKYDETCGDSISLPLDAEEVEAGSAMWEPYNNVTITNTGNDLQGVIDLANNYAKTVMLKISGSEARNQQDVEYISQPFTVAPHFAFKNTASSKLEVSNSSKLNITTQNSYFEAWIKPYSYPINDADAPYYPLITKKDPNAASDEDGLHYALRLLPTGQLSFTIASTQGERLREAISKPIAPAPNIQITDSLWYHVGVYLSIPENGTDSKIIFYVDGVPQDTGTVVKPNGEVVTNITRQLGNGIVLDKLNTYPTFIGYDFLGASGVSRYFDGEFREVRFWRNNPGGFARVSDPDYPNTIQLDNFIQGVLTVRAKELGQFGTTNYAQGLIAAYSFDGGSWINNGLDNTIPVYPSDQELVLHVAASCADGRAYSATEPYIRLVEPVYMQQVQNTEKELRVRWVGFDYNRNNLETFTAGQYAPNGKPADLALSVLGGAGSTNQHYPRVASINDNAGYINSMSLLTSINPFEFQGTSAKSQFASLMDLSIANPDENHDLVYTDQGKIEATAGDARFQLFARANINTPDPLEYDYNGQNGPKRLMSESPKFVITPSSNFTLRMLLEGYHGGAETGIVNNIGNTFENNGVRIRLYQANGNEPGVLVPNSTQISTKRYADWANAKNVANRGAGTNNFANIPYVFTEVFDSTYYVVVDHQNYLPVMSAYPARFKFTGDDLETWDIESGWDFQAWNGADNHSMTANEATETPTYFGTSYAAFVDPAGYTSDRTSTAGNWALTALNFTAGGVSTSTTNGLAALVGGDVVRDGQINASDVATMRVQTGSTNPLYDLTGDSYNNAIDRTIVYHNYDKVSSLRTLSLNNDLYPTESETGRIGIAEDLAYMTDANPLNVVDKNDPEFSLQLIANTKEAIINGNVDNSAPIKSANELLGGSIEYKVTASPVINGQYIDVPMYIQNTGSGDWALANASFVINYDPTVVSFNSMIQTSSVVFDAVNSSLGYNKAYYAPTDRTPNLSNTGTLDPAENIRSIEIDFDLTSKKQGLNVPSSATYLGTLRFNMLRTDQSFFFNWTKMCAVLDVNGVDLTNKGDFQVIKPIIVQEKVEIVSPYGGETFEGGSTNPIIWKYPNTDAQVFIEYSPDNGNSWNKINSTPVAVTLGCYNWNLPTISSTQCLVRINNAATNAELARSKSFNITIAPTAITRPATSDPVYASGAKDYIRWHSNEKVSVYFEYSENGTNWTKVTETVSSEVGQVAWTVKTANTKSAKVRMVNAQNGSILAISEPFKILTGTVTISNPKKGDVFKTLQKTQIKWASSSVSTFTLQLSTDGGANWTDVVADVKASNKLYNWTVPSVNSLTERAIVRAIYNNDPTLEYSRSGLFTIDPGTGIDELGQLAGFAIASITPNPVSNNATVTIEIPKESKLNVAIYNTAGEKIAVIADNTTFGYGSHDLHFNASGLANGVYVVRMQVGSNYITKEFVKVK